MKTEEDEAFDELAKRQGMWGGGFQAKRAAAADKQEPWNENEWRKNNWRCQHGWLRGEQCEICNALLAPKPAQDGKCKYCVDGCIACDARAQPAQEQWKCIGPPCKCNASNAKLCVYAVFTTPPLLAQEPYDQTALELCNVCGWKTLIPDDGCLNCERAQPAQEPVAIALNTGTKQGVKWLKNVEHGESLYTAPPKREWAGLTDEEREGIAQDYSLTGLGYQSPFKAIEAMLREKNT